MKIPFYLFLLCFILLACSEGEDVNELPELEEETEEDSTDWVIEEIVAGKPISHIEWVSREKFHMEYIVRIILVCSALEEIPYIWYIMVVLSITIGIIST